MTHGLAILSGGNIDELGRGQGQDTRDFSNKWFQLTVLLPEPVKPKTLGDHNFQRSPLIQ
jgi:hypothetical protein